jgi:hypothetical protein
MFVSHWLSLRQLRTPKQVQSHTASLKWHRHSCLCSDEHQPATSNHPPRPHFTFASAQPDPRFQSNFRELRSPNFNLGQRDELRLKWHRHSCLPRGMKGLCSSEHQLSTSTHYKRGSALSHVQPANESKNYCVEYSAR